MAEQLWRREALATYATLPWQSRGRLNREPEGPSRSPFQRDRDRIIHSTAFRRLKHKTQVFVYHEGDHYRTRLTHSLEVAQIARTICRTLRLDEDLGEAVALAHDLGHTPFGHAGEEALHAAMKPYGGFDHNAQTLRILTKLEERYAEFNGLNLTWETLEGAVKHNGPLLKDGRTLKDLPAAIVEYCQDHDLELGGHAGPEAQIAALSDDIAYNNHDIDDGLRAGLFEIADLMELPLVGEMFSIVTQKYPGIGPSRLIHEAVRRVINAMVEDVLAETRRRLADAAPEIGGRHPRPRPAGGGVLPAHGGDRPHGEGLPLQAHVRALEAQPLALQGTPGRGRPVRPAVRRAQLPALAVARARRAGRDPGPRPPGRRLHRRHDRPLRPRRAQAAVRSVRVASRHPPEGVD